MYPIALFMFVFRPYNSIEDQPLHLRLLLSPHVEISTKSLASWGATFLPLFGPSLDIILVPPLQPLPHLNKLPIRLVTRTAPKARNNFHHDIPPPRPLNIHARKPDRPRSLRDASAVYHEDSQARTKRCSNRGASLGCEFGDSRGRACSMLSDDLEDDINQFSLAFAYCKHDVKFGLKIWHVWSGE